jgi:hypothetical protein
MLKDRLLDFAERYIAAWCSQDAASVAAFYSAQPMVRRLLSSEGESSSPCEISCAFHAHPSDWLRQHLDNSYCVNFQHRREYRAKTGGQER